VLLVQNLESSYREASFLDDRFLSDGRESLWVPAAELYAAAAGIDCARPLHFIFHTGHVGSTLVSRLLDEVTQVLPLREPLPLRTLADRQDGLDARSDGWLALWSRGYRHTDAVLLKATSSAGRIAVPILRRRPEIRAVYLNLRVEPYLATLLAGEQSLRDLQGHAPQRQGRVRSRLLETRNLQPVTSVGELAALSWLAESFSQHDALSAFPQRVLRIDFEQFLQDVGRGIGAIVAHFALAADARALQGIYHSPTLARYSKAPQYEYSADLRSAVLAESRRNNATEIARGIAWLETLARRDAGVEAVFSTLGRS
jgi:hypothetical protein